MADFLHKKITLGTHQGVRVDIDHAANVMLLTELNFQNYKNGRAYDYYGGHYRSSPAVIRPPRAGTYHVVIDLGGGRAMIRYSVTIV